MSTVHRAGLSLAAVTALGLTMSPAAHATPPAADRGTTDASATGYDGAALHQKVKAVRAKGASGLMMEIKGPRGTYRKHAGYADLDPRRTAKVSDQYHIASVTKSMVTVLVLKEIEQGNWTLNTRVHDVWPNLYPGGGQATVGQLLSHRSGMPNHTEHMAKGRAWEKRWYDTQLINIAREKPFYFKGGASARYSNTGFVTLGKMLERQNGGKSLAGMLEYRVFKPAGMTRSRLSVTHSFMGGNGFRELATINGTLQRLKVNPSIFSGSGGVESNTADVNRFYKALFSGKLVSKATLDDMIKPRTSSGSLAGYGLGIYSINTACGTMYGHDGASFGTRNFAFSSKDGRSQVNIAWNGRSWDTETEPPVNDLLIEATRQTCTPATGGTPRTSDPVAPAPTIDQQHSALDPDRVG